MVAEVSILIYFREYKISLAHGLLTAAKQTQNSVKNSRGLIVDRNLI